MPRKKKEVVLEDVQGNHLIVRADGSLVWDWDALLKEVREATTLVSVTETKVKRTRKKKTAE